MVLAEVITRGLGYLVAEAGVTVTGQSGGILPVLVFGAGTDYALLMVSRYREELRRHENKHDAIRVTLRRTSPVILASGATVMAALLTLGLAEVTGTSGLGPIGALGIAMAMVCDADDPPCPADRVRAASLLALHPAVRERGHGRDPRPVEEDRRLDCPRASPGLDWNHSGARGDGGRPLAAQRRV